jgi:quercetin dioxygenase-like cupin family protein
MPTLIEQATQVASVGSPPKIIREVAGRVNTRTSELSLAHMTSPEGWSEPGQTPEFTEITYVLRGALHVQTQTTTLVVRAGQAVRTEPGEWIRYATPEPGGAEYIAVCTPAFSPDTVHRDPE